MSVTTTANPTTQHSLRILADYEVKHTGDNTNAAPPPNSHPSSTAPLPANWPRNYRRVPPPRPINTNLSLEDRPAGHGAAEFVFIQTMLGGCWVLGNVNSLWRATGGKINSNIFRYEIAGEW
ncbi:MAG: hypothetical protein M1834_003702 [Cirrosporium novae-zelandiae]|nr:MAG: hypothetical protein M1834_003702 [Cirrosporium novae-zelandiae]